MPFFGAWHFCDPTVSDPLEDGSCEHPFDTIQAAIDAACDGDTVIVRDGTYTGAGNRDLDFGGRAITVRSENGPENCTIDAQGNSSEPHRGFYFHSGEGEDSVVDGFTITGGYSVEGGGIRCDDSSPTITNNTITANTAQRSSGGAIYCSDNSSPAITNNTIANNTSDGGGGICCYDTSSPTITNCILWGNGDDLHGCSATYSCIQDGDAGEGNISSDPLFADPGNGDYHLKSEFGRWHPGLGLFALDAETSPCIDAGDPASDYPNETQRNGVRINMGAYGNTVEASKSGQLDGDLNNDCVVNILDLIHVRNRLGDYCE
ncbi:MAG: right-handed parallel beta-helix repeat-containing protein [Planctomycetes bacterium]|nr:right-handed parallel beta-helix repeat-containing protein [Planctomycetota bacterium]